MRLIEFELKGFAQHTDTYVRFQEDAPTLIVGPNESGKSQLLNGLIGTIFGLSDWERHVPWHGDPTLTGHLHIDVGGHQIVIRRAFAEDRVEVLRDGETVYTGRGRCDRHTAEDERYQQMIGDWVGFTDVDVFRDVIFVQQDQLADDRLAKRSGEIKRIISGSREASYESAIKDLDSQLDRLRRRPRQRNDREIEQLDAEITRLEERSVAASKAEADAVEIDDLGRSGRADLDKLRERRKRLSGLLTSLGQRQRLVDELERVNQVLSRASQDADQARRAADYRRQLQDEVDRLRVLGDPDPQALRDDRATLEHSAAECRKLEEEIDEIRREIDASQSAGPVVGARQTPARPRAPLIAAGLLLAVGSVSLGLAFSPIAFAGLLLAVILLAVAFAPATPSAPPTSNAEQVRIELLSRRRFDTQRKLDIALSRLDEIDARCQAWLAHSGESSLDALVSRLDRHREATVRLAEHGRSELDLEATTTEQNEALSNVAITQLKIDQLDEGRPELRSIEPERAAELRSTLERLTSDEERLQKDLNDVEVRRRVLQAATPDDAAGLNVLIREKRSELEHKQRLAKALELAIATMRSSVEEFQEHALDPVATQAGDIVKRITNGRYQELEIDQEQMTPTLRGAGPGDLTIEELSRGTRDQVYLALRVGLVDTLSGGRQLPLILDDPCVHFDEERLRATVAVLEEISKERQVVILSKDEAYAHWFEAALRLDRPTTHPGQNPRLSTHSMSPAGG